MRHDFNAALNAVAEKPITDKVLESPALRGGFDAFDRLKDCAQRPAHEPRHQKKRSADASIRSRSGGSRLPRVVTRPERQVGVPGAA
jgi:hypothetical protein